MNDDTYWVFSGIYGWPETQNRNRTWQLMNDIKPNQDTPWLVVGDFNAILWSSEKSGGNQKPLKEMNDFRNSIQRCNLTDLGFSGNRFTWSNGRDGANNILERLDRALASSGWQTIFPAYRIRHLPRLKSDHNPVMVEYYENNEDGICSRRKKKRFRFENMWLHHPLFTKTLTKMWNKKGRSMSYEEKARTCGNELLNWDQTEFGNIRKKAMELNQTLSSLHDQEQTENIVKETHKTEMEIEKILKMEECMWHQRSRTLWLKEGDKNSRYFHQKATMRQKRNNISKIKDENGQWSTNRKEVNQIINSYFLKLFSSDRQSDIDVVVNALENKVSVNMNENLMKPFTVEEVLRAVKQMHPNKAPGPDGMTPFFFQKFWHIVKHEVLESVLGVLNFEHDPSSLNFTHIILIPKVKYPDSPKDFRPISLCNVIFRIISKTVANRLKVVLPHVISKSQSAFISGRSITDNAMIAFEIFHSMKNRKTGNKGFMALKLDMSKAYDRVEWNFLRSVMSKLGFCLNWVNLIMRCVTTVSYSVLINGDPTPPFNPERGLRQGDPLSPYLFLFCAEAFSNLLVKAEQERRIHGFQVAKRAPIISHLFFADDTILFTQANNREAEEIKNVIHQYEMASGQRINLEKTELTVSGNASLSQRQELATQLGVREVDEHNKYLGLPTLIGRSKKKVFEIVIERINKKMKDWKEQTLSKAGKEVLIKAVIQAIPSYVMSCFLLPLTICQEIEKAVARFFWGASKDVRKCHWVKWEQLCKSKMDGGLGFREMHQFNLAMIAKQFWSLMNNNDSTIFEILHCKYFPNESLMTASLGYHPSYLWRSLLASRNLVKTGTRWRVGNGQKIHPWDDAWIGMDNPKKSLDIGSDHTRIKSVGDLIDMQTNDWNMRRVQEFFCKDDADQIVSIPLSDR